MNNKVKSIKTTFLLLALSPMVSFLKPVFVSIVDTQGDFGNYSLAIAYSVWFSYILNSGIYEGLLSRYAKSFASGKQLKITLINRKICSLWIIILVFVSAIAIIFSIFTQLYFFSASILLSFSSVSFNIYSARLRVSSHILPISLIQMIRLVISLSITYLLLSFTTFGLDVVLFFDALALCIINVIVLIPNFTTNFDYRKLLKIYIGIASKARNLTYISGLKASCLLLERQSASALFGDEVFSQYAQLLILFQAAIVGLGLIPQLWQQNILFWTLKNGLKKALLYQAYYILILSLGWAVFWTFLYQLSFRHSFFHEMPVIFFIGAAGVMYGGSYIDSIFLALKKTKGLIPIYVSTICLWLIVMIVTVINANTWLLEYQAISLLVLSIMITTIPPFYLLIKKIV